MNTKFPIVPAGNGPLWIVGLVMLVLVGVSLLMVSIVLASRNTEFEVSSDALIIKAAMYGRTIPITHLKLDEARTVNLDTEPNLRIRMRTNGTGMPGYLAGWFRLTGGVKALLHVTDRTSVACIPTTEGFTVLLSTAEPQKLIDRLKNHG